jgi:hypothetical protein
MATVSQMIRAVSKEKNVLQNIVEKDYALSYLLSAIYSVFCYELVVGWVRNPPRLSHQELINFIPLLPYL